MVSGLILIVRSLSQSLLLPIWIKCLPCNSRQCLQSRIRGELRESTFSLRTIFSDSSSHNQTGWDVAEPLPVPTEGSIRCMTQMKWLSEWNLFPAFQHLHTILKPLQSSFQQILISHRKYVSILVLLFKDFVCACAGPQWFIKPKWILAFYVRFLAFSKYQIFQKYLIHFQNS